MSDHTPITGPELEEMKRRCIAAPLAIGGKQLVKFGDTVEQIVPVSPKDAKKINVCLLDLPRCIAEIERLQGLVGKALTREDVTPNFSVSGLKPHKVECTAAFDGRECHC